jgi:mycothiol synthase
MASLLPVSFTVRTPRESELEAICEMFTACDLADCGQPDSPLDQLRADWRDPKFHPETDAWLVVTSEEQVVGYAALDQNRYIRIRYEIRVHPDYRGQGIEGHLLELVERRSAEFVPLAPPEARVFLQAWMHHGNRSLQALLEQQGYVCNRHTWAMTIALPEAPAAPSWPEGITLRPFVPERDAYAVFKANDESFQDHWGHLPGVFEHWYQSHIVAQEHFDPSLWFIAMDGNEVAGIALCGYYLQDGLVNILGVRRPWRRSGLGLALLRHAFGTFYRRGTHKVGLGVDSQSLTGATRLYERAGMHIELQYDTYSKDLRAGVELSIQTLEA